MKTRFDKVPKAQAEKANGSGPESSLPTRSALLIRAGVGLFSFAGGVLFTLGLAIHADFISLPVASVSSLANSGALRDEVSTFAENISGTMLREINLWIGLQLGKAEKPAEASVPLLPTTLPKNAFFDDNLTKDESTALPNANVPVGIIPNLQPDSSASDDSEESVVSNPVPVFDREGILNDKDNRISEDFHISEGLRDRVGFWFDVYSKYDSNQRIIHHSRFPWIVFKIVDVSPIINAPEPHHRWLRNVLADKLVKNEEAKIRKALKSVSRRKSLDNLNEYEALVVNALSKLKGSPQKQAAIALHNLRVQVGQRDFFQEGLEVSPRYLSGMEDIFRSHKLPIELTRIPFVESSFNKKATSKVGAMGVWQFMGNTGKKFMIVNDRIDERRSPFKASEGAARLLKENHLIMHRSWPLAITAWNHGPPGVRKAIAAAHNQDLAVIIAKYHSKSFDFASSNFYSEFLGALYSERYSAEIFSGLNREKVLEGRVVHLARAAPAKTIFKTSGLSKDDFELLNPDLQLAIQKNVSIPAGFRMMVTEESRKNLARFLKVEKTDQDEKVADLSNPHRIQ